MPRGSKFPFSAKLILQNLPDDEEIRRQVLDEAFATCDPTTAVELLRLAAADWIGNKSHSNMVRLHTICTTLPIRSFTTARVRENLAEVLEKLYTHPDCPARLKVFNLLLHALNSYNFLLFLCK